MKKEDLDLIIEKLETENCTDKAFFGVYYTGNYQDGEAYIKANKQGLELFARELLKASAIAEEIQKDTLKNIIVIDTKIEWISGDIWLEYIEPKMEDRIDVKAIPYIKSWKNTLGQYLSYLIIGTIILSLILGLKSICKEIISWF